MVTYRDYIVQLSPWWIDYFYKNGRLQSYGDLLDFLYQDAKQATINGRVNTCDVSALNAHGTNFNLPRVGNETDLNYRAYLQMAWSVWEEAGTDPGILAALARIGLTNAKIVHWQDLMDAGVPIAFGGSYHIIPGSNANGGVRYVSLTQNGVQIIQQVSPNSVPGIVISQALGQPPVVRITLHGDPTGNSLSTAHDVVNMINNPSPSGLYPATGVIVDYTGDGSGLALAGSLTLDWPIYTHFYIDIDQPNNFGPPNIWDGVLQNTPFTPVPLGALPSVDFYGITGNAVNDIYIVGASGTIYYFNGNGLNNQSPMGATQDFLAVATDGIGNVIAVGKTGQLANKSGGGWTVTTVGMTDYRCCAMTGVTDGWAGGAGGVMAQYSMGIWSSFMSPVMTDINGMFAISSTNVWACGANSSFLHWDGMSWSTGTIPSTGAQTMTSIWGTDSSNVWVTDSIGNVYHWNGMSWATTPPQASNIVNLDATFGFGLSSTYFAGDVGGMEHYNGSAITGAVSSSLSDLTGIYGATESDLWVVGKGGTILRRTLNSLIQSPLPKGPGLYAVWASSSNDIWAGGGNGRLVHYDGTSWIDITGLPLYPKAVIKIRSFDLHHIWFVGTHGMALVADSGGFPVAPNNQLTGTSETINGIGGWINNDVWLVGTNGFISHWDGTNFSQVNSGTSATLFSMTAFGPSNAWAVGAGGTILHWDGGTWKPAISPVTTDLYCVDANFACGAGGVILHRSGTTWTQMPSPTVQNLRAILASDGGPGYAVGDNGTILSWDGASWTAEVSGTSNHLYDVSLFITPNPIAVGASGTIVSRIGGVWVTQSSGVSYDILTVDAILSNFVYAGGTSGPILQGPSPWTITFDFQFLPNITSFWGSATNDIWAGLSNGQLLHWDGNRWTIGATLGSLSVSALWGFSSTSIYATCTNGIDNAIYYYNGVTWTSMILPMGVQELTSIWGASANNVFAAGGHISGEMYHYDGISWTSMTLPAMTPPLTTVRGYNSQYVFACGLTSTMLAFTNGTWNTMTAPINNPAVTFTGMVVYQPTDLWVCATNGLVYHYDGIVWTSIFASVNYYLLAIASIGPDQIITVGIDPNASPNIGVVFLQNPYFNIARNVWDGGEEWDLQEIVPGTLEAIKAIVRKFKASGTSCRFLRINIGGTWVVVPMGELIEQDANGNYITDQYLFSW